jgi:hypothetical protein
MLPNKKNEPNKRMTIPYKVMTIPHMAKRFPFKILKEGVGIWCNNGE